MKKMLTFLTFVLCLTVSSMVLASSNSEDLFFSIKANLWYQGVKGGDVLAKIGEVDARKSTQVPENKETIAKKPLPEELVTVLKNL